MATVRKGREEGGQNLPLTSTRLAPPFNVLLKSLHHAVDGERVAAR